jgi:hypothetical protein
MAWKLDRWIGQFDDGLAVAKEFSDLPARDLTIVACAVLDTCLAELFAARLSGPRAEIESFLGLDGDGRAPVGSFGARIQFGIVMGLLDSMWHARRLRALKALRNAMAHRATARLLDSELRGPLRSLVESTFFIEKAGVERMEAVNGYWKELLADEEEARFVVLAAFGSAYCDLRQIGKDPRE